MASSYYRSGKTSSAYSLLTRETVSSSKCRLLLARCCFDLKKFGEAEEAILSKFSLFESKTASKFVVSIEELVQEYGESASFVAQLLGQISVRTERVSRAVDYFSKSLKLNPFLWSSFEALVQLGHPVDADKVFDVSTTDFSLCHGSNPLTRVPHVPSGMTDVSSLPTQTPHQGLQGKDVLQKRFDINSPFAVLKSGGEPGSIDVFTPESCSFIPHGLSLAPQKQPPAAVKTVKKICLMAHNNVAGDLLGSETPSTIRASFGVFPLGDQQHNVSSLRTPLLTPMEEAEMKQTENVVRAPKRDASRRHTTRRGTQSNTTTNTRSTVHRGQIFSQSGNINQDHTPSNNNPSNNNNNANNNMNQATHEGHLRRSTRLFNSLSSVKENSKNTSRNQENSNKTSVSNKTPPKKQRRHTSSTVTSATISQNRDKGDSGEDLKREVTKQTGVNQEELIQAAIQMQRTSVEGLMNLLKHLGKGQLFLGQYRMNEAIEVLKSLPEKHLKSGWVLSSLARCYFEQSKYTEAIKYYEEAREREGHRLQGCEYYSTALWHLQQEVKLSMLSQELIDFDKESPETWCVAGNCFSLQKEHETAIKFLQRAIQVDPDFAYAYTLLGHELVLTEEMDHATACFRSAIRIDPRHYNAWCGLAMICYKQEKYDLAEVHYRTAVDICPSSPALRCHLGVVMHALKKTDQALVILDEAIRMDPKNALSRFHRASIYFSVDRHEEALRELEALKILIPKESLVYFLIGKVSNLTLILVQLLNSFFCSSHSRYTRD